MAISLVVREILPEQSRAEDVKMFTSKTTLMNMDEVEKAIQGVIDKFHLKEMFHSMRGMSELGYTTENWNSRTNVTLKETGVARMYGNGKTMLAIHSYEVEKQSETTYRHVDPLIHVVGYDHEETLAVSTDIRLCLLSELVRCYAEADTRQQRQTIAEDISSNLRTPRGSNPPRVMADLDAIIDAEIKTIEMQLLNKVLSYERPSASITT